MDQSLFSAANVRFAKHHQQFLWKSGIVNDGHLWGEAPAGSLEFNHKIDERGWCAPVLSVEHNAI